MKNKKIYLIITTIICLLPIIAGVKLYDLLPDQIATHFNIDGQADSYMNKAIVVYGLPVLMAAVNLIANLVIAADPKKQNMNPALRGFALLLIPIISVAGSGIILGNALGKDMPSNSILMIVFGVLFLFIGNYLPKTKQSYTVGIRLPWTLASEENWNKTHRLGGFMFVIAGIISLLLGIFRIQSVIPFMIVIFTATLIPSIYSYIIYKKEQK